MLRKLRKNKKFLDVAQKLNSNHKKWKLIGRGSFGYAYDMLDGRVCKITTSRHETYIAEKLKSTNKKYPYLYKVLQVFHLNRNDKFWLGLIITPKYKQLTQKQKAELYELFCFLDLSPRFRISSIKQIKTKIANAAKQQYLIKHRILTKKDKKLLAQLVSRRMKVFNHYDILYMLRNLKDANIGPEDIHYENILKTKEHYVLIDIGC